MTNAKKQTQQGTVPFDDLVARIGNAEGVRAVMDREGAETTTDWAGRQAVSVEHAAVIINSHETAMRSHAEKMARFDRYMRDRKTRRREAGESRSSTSSPTTIHLGRGPSVHGARRPWSLDGGAAAVAEDRRAARLRSFPSPRLRRLGDGPAQDGRASLRARVGLPDTELG